MQTASSTLGMSLSLSTFSSSFSLPVCHITTQTVSLGAPLPQNGTLIFKYVHVSYCVRGCESGNFHVIGCVIVFRWLRNCFGGFILVCGYKHYRHAGVNGHIFSLRLFLMAEWQRRAVHVRPSPKALDRLLRPKYVQ